MTEYKLPYDIESLFVEINLRKTKWLLYGKYRPPSQSAEHYWNNIGHALDFLGQKHGTFLLASDVNLEEREANLSIFLSNYDAKNLVKSKICFKNSINPQCIDLFIPNSICSYYILPHF